MSPAIDDLEIDEWNEAECARHGVSIRELLQVTRMKEVIGQTDVELGGAVEVERSPRAGIVLSVRLSPDEAAQLAALADEKHAAMTQLAKAAITAFLEAQRSKEAAATS